MKSSGKAVMKLIIFGVTGHQELHMPLDDLEVEDLEVGREFPFNGQIYEIRSLFETEDGGIRMNVVLVMD